MEHARPVSVHHNIATDDTGTRIGLHGYAPGQPVVPVYRYYSTIHDDASTEEDYDIIAEEAYWLFAAGYRLATGPNGPTIPTDPRTLTYQQKGNRPLDVGDVLRIDNTWWACTATGWTRIAKPTLVQNPTPPVEGTTPVTGRRTPARGQTSSWTVYTGSNR